MSLPGAATPLRRLSRSFLPLRRAFCSSSPSSPLAIRPRRLGHAAGAPPPPLTAALARPFSASAPARTKTFKPHLLPSELIPSYPYGERHVYKQSNRGLYGSVRIRFGNVVAPEHNNKTRRSWRPNVHLKALYSPALDARVRTRLTARVLKTIRREGGIDNYLLKTTPARLRDLGPGGWSLRWLVMQTTAVQRRFNHQRRAMGLPEEPVEDRGDMIQYALDFATPGALSLRSRATRDKIRRGAVSDTFVLGDPALARVEGVQELPDEAEEALLRELPDEDAPPSPEEDVRPSSEQVVRPSPEKDAQQSGAEAGRQHADV